MPKIAPDPNATDFLIKAVNEWGLDPTQPIDMNDPVSRLVMAIVITTIEQGRDIYDYSEFIKGCAMSAGIDPDVFYKEVNQTKLGIENNSNAGGYVSPKVPVVVNGGPSVPSAVSNYVQLGLPIAGAVTLNNLGFSTGYNAVTGAYNAVTSNGGSATLSNPIYSTVGGSNAAILNTIKFNESGGNYGAINYTATAAGFPKTVDFSNMTISEVQAYQSQMIAAGASSSAIGAYQITKSTLATWTRDAGLDPSTTKFTPDVQDQIAGAGVNRALISAGGDISKIPVIWYTGNAQGKSDYATPAQVAAYQSKWLSQYEKESAAAGANTTMNAASDNSGRSTATSLSPDQESANSGKWANQNGYTTKTPILDEKGVVIGYSYSNTTTDRSVIEGLDGRLKDQDGIVINTTGPAVPKFVTDLGYNKVTANSDGTLTVYNSNGNIYDPTYNPKSGKLETPGPGGSVILNDPKPVDPQDYVTVRDGRVVSAGTSVAAFNNTEPGFSGQSGELLTQELQPKFDDQGSVIYDPLNQTYNNFEVKTQPGPITDTIPQPGYNRTLEPITGTPVVTTTFLQRINDNLSNIKQANNEKIAEVQSLQSSQEVLKGSEASLLQQKADLTAKLDAVGQSEVRLSQDYRTLQGVNSDLSTAQAQEAQTVAKLEELNNQYDNFSTLNSDPGFLANLKDQIQTANADLAIQRTRIAQLADQQFTLSENVSNTQTFAASASDIRQRIAEVDANLEANRAQQTENQVQIDFKNESISISNDAISKVYTGTRFQTEQIAQTQKDIADLDKQIADIKTTATLESTTYQAYTDGPVTYTAEQQARLDELNSIRSEKVTALNDQLEGLPPVQTYGPTNQNVGVIATPVNPVQVDNADKAVTYSSQSQGYLYEVPGRTYVDSATGETVTDPSTFYKNGVQVTDQGNPLPTYTTVIDANTGQRTITVNPTPTESVQVVPAGSRDEALANSNAPGYSTEVIHTYQDENGSSYYYRNGQEVNAEGTPLGNFAPTADAATTAATPTVGTFGLSLGTPSEPTVGATTGASTSTGGFGIGGVESTSASGDVSAVAPASGFSGSDSSSTSTGATASGSSPQAGGAPGASVPTIPPC